MPEGTLQVEVKVKTTWGKFTMIQNTHTRMEKYRTWEKAKRCYAKSKKGRTTSKAASVSTGDNTSKTDMPTSQEFRYPPIIFTDPTHTQVMTHTDSEADVKYRTNFLGSYCEHYDINVETCCWCFPSDWEEELDANNPNPSVEISLSPTMRKPPTGWSKSRCKVIKAKDTTRPPSPKEEFSTDNFTNMH